MGAESSSSSSGLEMAEPGNATSESEEQTSLYGENDDPSYVHAIKAPEMYLRNLWRHLPLKLKIFNNESMEMPLNQMPVVVTGREYRFELEEDLTIQLDKNGHNDIDLKMSEIEFVFFTNCNNVSFLDISHTFIRHIDIRQLMNLRDIRLTNTNFRKLNLMNERKLSVLYCNYTLVDYLRLSPESRLSKLHIEGSGELKFNRIVPCSEAFAEENETVDSHQFRVLNHNMAKPYVISYPQMGDEEEVKVILPGECKELVDRDIKRCEKLEIIGLSKYYLSTIDSLNIVDYPNLQKLTIRDIECIRFSIARLPSLADIKVKRLQAEKILLMILPGLKKITLTECRRLKQLVIRKQ